MSVSPWAISALRSIVWPSWFVADKEGASAPISKGAALVVPHKARELRVEESFFSMVRSIARMIGLANECR